jgi:hypothetical protein
LLAPAAFNIVTSEWRKLWKVTSLTCRLALRPLSINGSGVITWTPSQVQSPGTNTITTIVTNTNPFDPVTVNPHLSATNSFIVIVYAPTLAPMSGVTVDVGQTVSFTASATDNDPTRTLTFSLVAAPAGATITAGGVFNWQPVKANANSSNPVQVTVTDNSVPSLSDTKSFTIFVNPLPPPPRLSIALSSGVGVTTNVVLSWPTNAAGFGLQQNSNLATANWQTVTNTPTITNGLDQVTLPATPPNNFFQLFHP